MMKDNEKRLTMVCDVKCGFNNLYLVEKGVSINLDFLAEPDLYVKSEYKEIASKLKGALYTRKELYEKYRDNPAKIFKDYEIYNIIKKALSLSISVCYFYALDMQAPENANYPELFELSNFELRLISKEEFDILHNQDMQDIIDLAKDLKDELEEATESQDQQIDSIVENGEKIWKA